MATRFTVNIDATYMRFDPSDVNFYKDICAAIPEFAEYKKLDDGSRLRVFAWIVCMYDQHTPLMKEVKDLYKRKVYAATLTGINPNKATGKYKEYAEKLLLGTDKAFNKLIVSYISSSSSPDYKQLMAHVTMQDTILQKIISGTARKQDQEMFDKSTDTIKKLTNLLYGTGEREEVYEARRALYQQVTVDMTEMRAESIAKRIAGGEGLPDEYNPYEKGYVPDDINFVSDDPEVADEN
jgi:hypothetical protein